MCRGYEPDQMRYVHANHHDRNGNFEREAFRKHQLKGNQCAAGSPEDG